MGPQSILPEDPDGASRKVPGRGAGAVTLSHEPTQATQAKLEPQQNLCLGRTPLGPPGTQECGSSCSKSEPPHLPGGWADPLARSLGVVTWPGAVREELSDPRALAPSTRAPRH